MVMVYAHDGVARSTGLRRKSKREGLEAEMSLLGSKRRCYNDTRDDWEVNSFKYQGEEFGLNCQNPIPCGVERDH